MPCTHAASRSRTLPHHAGLLLASLACAALLVTTGCQKDRRGRIDPYETTRSEEQSRQILPVALLEFSDQAAPRLVRDLRELPEIRDNELSTVILGDLDNQTQIVPTSDFEVAMRRLRNKLINSDLAGDQLAFVERRQRVGNLAERERVVGGEGDIADAEDYDAASTYALNGDFIRVSRGRVNLYYMEFQLVSFETNRIVWSDRYEVKQQDVN
ncbi:MAG: hypothetical protein ACOC1G_08690 [Phycisphaeraceae bacterium]